MHRQLVHFAAKRRLSVWLCIATLIVAATAMHPTAAGIFIVLIQAVLIFTVRAISQLEGKGDGEEVIDALARIEGMLRGK